MSSKGEEPLEAWNECLDHNTSLAWCHVQRVTLEQFGKAVGNCPNPEDRKVMRKVLYTGTRPHTRGEGQFTMAREKGQPTQKAI